MNCDPVNLCHFNLADRPCLVVVIDTEEEFDWGADFSRNNTSVRAIRSLSRIQRIFQEYNIQPVYVVDYPVASQPEGYEPLRDVRASGGCLIGAHLHPWVNPPYEEVVNRYNSFPGNLPHPLEAEKLKILTDCIGDKFGQRPTIYKAGRYGFGQNTAAILEQQGYEVDLSVCPHMDYSAEGGPDFTANSAAPHWFGKRGLLELPLTVGFAGLLRRWGAPLHRAASRGSMASLHAPGILARLGLVNKIWLSPEGYRNDEHFALVRDLYQDGLRIFSFAFHSPSLDYGHTPYVRTRSDLDGFLDRCRRFFDFFMGDMGGRPTTPLELKYKLARSISSVGE
jgi:hypothetical protein